MTSAEAAAGRELRRPYAGETYYGRPAVKPSPWGSTVGAYLFVAGLAGAAQVLATTFKLARPTAAQPMVRHARFLAAAGVATGAVLLVIDLRTKKRWYNMLRIFRITSPMSIGTYLLSAFGAFTGVTLLGELLGRHSSLGRLAVRAGEVVQVPAAIAGAGMATYTAALFSSTSIPEWAAIPQRLGVEFASSSVASAAAALSIADHAVGAGRNARTLNIVAALASIVHMISSKAAESRLESMGVSIKVGRAQRQKRVADLVVAGAVPIVLYAVSASAGRPRLPSLLASASILGGNLASRLATLKSGNASAERPRDYFRLARPEHTRALASADRVNGSRLT